MTRRFGLTTSLTVFMILCLLVMPNVVLAKGDCPPPQPTPEANAWAKAYVDIDQLQILRSGLNEINHEVTFVFVAPIKGIAVAGGEAQSGKGLLTAAGAGAEASVVGQAWGSVIAPDGTTVYWFNTGMHGDLDYDLDAEVNFLKASDAEAFAIAKVNQKLVFTATINLDQIGDWMTGMGVKAIAEAFASAGYLMCDLRGKCYGDEDFALAKDCDWAELWDIFHVYDSPQLPSLKIWVHTDESSDFQIYRGDSLINPWTVDALCQKPIEMVTPYDESLAGPGGWCDTQRGEYMIQLWDPVLGHSRDLFGIFIYQTKITGEEIHLWPYPKDGDPVVQNRGALIFATRPAAEAIQSRYQELGRNPLPGELTTVTTGAVNMSMEQLEVYLAVSVS